MWIIPPVHILKNVWYCIQGKRPTTIQYRNMTHYSQIRGMESEALVAKALRLLRGVRLFEKRKSESLRGQVIDFIQAESNDPLDRSHVDFLVRVRSDTNAQTLNIPIQAKSSERGEQVFRRKCRRRGWGPIQVVVVEVEESLDAVVEKVKNALVMGYHALRRAFNTEVWDFRRTVFLGENPYRRREHGNRDQWCPRFNAARRCWG